MAVKVVAVVRMPDGTEKRVETLNQAEQVALANQLNEAAVKVLGYEVGEVSAVVVKEDADERDSTVGGFECYHGRDQELQADCRSVNIRDWQAVEAR